jgi:hypothetical protein
MIILSMFEQFALQMAISLLSLLSSSVKNQVEQDALQAAVAFLQKLLTGNVSAV